MKVEDLVVGEVYYDSNANRHLVHKGSRKFEIVGLPDRPIYLSTESVEEFLSATKTPKEKIMIGKNCRKPHKKGINLTQQELKKILEDYGYNLEGYELSRIGSNLVPASMMINNSSEELILTFELGVLE